MIVVIYVLVACFLLSLVAATFAAVSGAPWVPAFRRDVEAVLDDLKITKGMQVIELGCGDGRLLQEAAKRGATVTGFEINPLLWCIAWFRLRRYKRSRIKLGNFWKHSLAPYDAVITFLVPRTVPRLEVKAADEMKSGSTLLSYIFELPTKKARLKRHHWFLYDY